MKIKIKNPFNKMKKMSPKDLFSKKNFMTMIAMSILMAGLIAGTFILLTYAAPATTINNVVYQSSDPAAGNKTVLVINTNGDFTATNGIQCPAVQGVPGDGVCYATTGVTASTGITGNVTAILRSNPNSAIKVFYDAANTVADINSASISIAGFGDAIGTISKTGFQNPPPANPTSINGSILYTAINGAFGNKSTLQVEFNAPLNDTNKLGSCPAVTGVSGTCYDVAVVTASSGITGAFTAVMRMDPSNNRIILVSDSQNIISSAPPTGSITFGATFGGIVNPITSTSFATPIMPPAGINGGILFTTNNGAYGNKSTLQVEFNGNLTDAGIIACPGDVTGVSGTNCYGTGTVTASSGITGTITAIMRLNPTNRLMVVYDSQNVIANMGAASISFAGAGDMVGTITGTSFSTPAVPPAAINGGILYTANNGAYGNKSTLQVEFNGNLTDANKLGSCPAVTGVSGTCYGTGTVTASSGITGTITAVVRLNPTNRLMVVYDSQNVIANMGAASISFAGAGDMVGTITGTSFSTPAIPNPSSISGQISYNAQNPVINNYKTVMLVTFNQDLNSASGTGSCAAGLGIPAGATCYNPSGVTDLSGSSLANGVTKSNIVALVKASSYPQFQGQNSKLVALFDIPNAASNPASLTNLSISFANFSGISGTITGTSFINETPDWHISTNETVYIQSQQPVAGSSTTTAINQLQIKYSGPIDMSTVTNSNVSVLNGTGSIATSFGFDQTTFTLTIKLSQNPITGVLALNLNNLKAANGTSISNSHFEWNVTNDSATKPQVVSTSPSNNTTGVSPIINDIIIRFDQPLASPLNTTTGITITPSIAISTPYFDPADNTLHLQPKAALTANTQFTIKLITKDGQNNAVVDSNGNTLKGLSNNIIDNYNLVFTTGATDNTAPRLTWASFKTGEVWIGYNTTLKTSATTTANWGITCGGTPVSLTQATISNNSAYSYLEIKGLTLTAGANCTATLSNVTGLNDIAFGGTDNAISGTVMSTTSYTMGEDANWGYGMCMTGTTCDSATRRFDPMVMQWSPIKFDPNIKIQGVEANETLVSFPTSKALTNGDKIVITLPTGSSINTGTLGTIGTDINGNDGATLSNVYYANGKVTISSSTYDQTQNKVTITINIDANGDGADASATTNASSYLEFILKGFINGSASTYDASQNTGGASATYSTVSGTTGQPTESIGQSTPYTVATAGAASISGSVTKSVGGTGIQNVTVIAEGSNGKISTITDSSGNYTISNLTNGGIYSVFIDGNSTPGNYVISSNQNTVTASGSTTGINFKLDEGTKTINVTIQNGSITGKVMVEGFNYSKNQHVAKQVTLSGGGTTASSLMVTPGEWEITVNFFNEATLTSTAVNKTAGDFGFMKPQGQIVNVTEASGTQSVTLSLASTDATINVTVQDSLGATVSGANVYAYRPDGTIGGTQATTDATGTCALKLKSGTYTVGAMMTGNSGMQEKSVTVAANGTASATFQINVPSIIISGTVTGSNKEAWINAYNQTSGFSAMAKSDKETGIYSLRVNENRTYTITASNTNGQNSATGAYASGNQNIVPIVSSNIASVDFVNTASNFGTISGTVTPAESGVKICAELYNTTTRNAIKAGGCSATNDSGAFTITTSRNAVSGERYKLSAYSMTYGALPSIDNIDISSTDATNKNISAGTTYQVTLNITGVPSTASSVFFNMMNKTTWKGTNFEIKSITNGTATKTFSLPEGTYDTTLSIPGLGEIAPDTGKSVNLTSDQTLNFTVGNMNADIKTLNVTVTNGSGTAVQGAIVTADDFTAGTSTNGSTDADGKVTLKIKVATSVTIRADSTNFSSTKTTFKKSDLSSINNVSIELGSQKSSTVTFNVTGTPNSVWVDLTSADGSFWNGTSLNSAGTATINVPANLTNATAYLHAQTGESKTVTNVTAGQTISTTFASFSAPAAWLSPFLDNTPVSSPFNPNTGMSLDDSLNTGVNLEIGASAFGTDSDQYSARILTVANTPSNSALPTRGIIGKEVTFTDANGNIVTDITGEYEISIFLFKAEAKAAKGVVFDTYNDLLTAQLGYWDSAMNSYVSELTTKTAYIQETAGSAWTIIDLSTLIANITINPDYYYDYKIEFKSIVNHATIFSTIVGSDGTPPSAPTGLSSIEASTTSATLTWNANSEPDLMEYEIYRSTSPSVTISDLNQVNTSPVTTNSFTDGIATHGTYYYIVTAVDDSGNESVASSESSVVMSASTQVTVGNTIQGSPVTPSSQDNDIDEDTETGDVDEGTDVDSGITLEEGTDDEAITEESDQGEETTETDYSSHWANDYIEKIIAAGIAQGISSTQFEPDRDLTRAEMTKMVLNAFDYDVGPVESSTFSDVDVDEWYAPYVEKAYTAGIVIGYSDGTFKPNNLVNRAEAMKIIVNTYAIVNDLTLTANSLPFTDVVQDAWYTKYISYGYYKGIVGGYSDGTFKPENPVTRAEFSKMTVLLLGL